MTNSSHVRHGNTVVCEVSAGSIRLPHGWTLVQPALGDELVDGLDFSMGNPSCFVEFSILQEADRAAELAEVLVQSLVTDYEAAGALVSRGLGSPLQFMVDASDAPHLDGAGSNVDVQMHFVCDGNGFFAHGIVIGELARFDLAEMLRSVSGIRLDHDKSSSPSGTRMLLKAESLT